MARYRKKPVVIDAFRYWLDPRPDWFCDKVTTNEIVTYETHCEIKTLEGVMRGEVGDYIIQGVVGEIYPCKPSIFLESYMVTSICGKCGEEKSADQFYADKSRANGCHTYCINCAKILAKAKYIERGGALYSREMARKWRAANPKRSKSHKLKHAFGITLQDYELLFERQNGACGVCFIQPDEGQYLCVDHEHKTGQVRGLLCDGCNKGLGFFRDSPERLIAAVRYLMATYEPAE